MKIRAKVISLQAILFVLLIGIEIAVQREIVMPSFAELEREDAKVSMTRIDSALDVSLESLKLSAADWGNWSEVYGYVRAPSARFVSTNVTPLALKQLQVDVLQITDLAGHVLLSSARDAAGRPIADLDWAEARTLPARFPWLDGLAAGRTATGLVGTNHGPMMLAAAPVLDGSGVGAPLGAVLMGRLLTPARLASLATQAQVSLAIGAPRTDDAGRLGQSGSVTRIERPLRDVYGRPLATVEVELPRSITARGRSAVIYASCYLIGAAVAVLALLVVILSRVVLAPLARVTRHAVSIGRGNDLTARLNLDSGDEIGCLAREFDGMVARLEATRSEIVDQSFQAGFAELARGVLHNLGNALTPLGVRLSRLEGRLRGIPAQDLERACEELGAADAGASRQADLIEFLRLGTLEVAAAVADSRADVEVMQRQTLIVQGALKDLMGSTRNEPLVEAVRLPDLVSQTLEIVPDGCRQRLTVHPHESLGRVGPVRVARTVLRQILQNLIINAADAVRDAGRDRGVLELGAEIVRENERTQLHLRCRDDGVGIAQADLERIFEKGYSTKSRETNSGIGLHWCANAIAGLGGRIWAASEGPGLGASLHLMLPVGINRGWSRD